MIIRCPHCDHTRTINSDKIPPGAELATCPRCKNRFRFRALEKADAPVFDPPKEQSGQPDRGFREPPGKKPHAGRSPQGAPPLAPASEEGSAAPSAKTPAAPSAEQPRPSYTVQEVQRPQSAFREAAEQSGVDVWDAVDALHQRWENQMDQHVTEVVTPRPSKADSSQQARPSRKERRISGVGAALSGDDGRAGAPAGDRKDAGSPRFPAISDLYDSIAEEENEHASQSDLPPLPDIAARTLVNYHEQGSSPEDIVDEDIKILQHSPSEHRPMRDLGKLKTIKEPRPEESEEPEDNEPVVDGRDHTRILQDRPPIKTAPQEQPLQEQAPHKQPPQEEPEESFRELSQSFFGTPPDQEGEESQVPWENQEEYGGWFRALLTTIYFVMLRGPSFYSNLGKAGAPLSHCYLFFLTLGYIAIIGSVLWAEITMLIIRDAAPLVDNLLTLPVLLVVAPLALGLMQLFVTGCIRLQLKILAPDRSDFVTSYRITAYSVAPFVLCLVPFVGPSLGAAWFAFALATGCRYALGLSWGIAVAVTLPPAGLLIGGLCWFFLS